MKLPALLLLAWALLWQDGLPELDAVLSPAEKQQFERATRFQDKLKALRPVLDRHSETAGRMLAQKNPQAVLASVQAIRVVVREGARITAQVTNPKARRSRAARRMEIRLRKLGEELESLRNASPFELWDDLDFARDEVNAFRDDLLEGFFDLPPPSDSGGFAWTVEASWGLSAKPAAGQRRLRGSVDGDQFTPAEYEKVQDAQDLKLRVKVFLEIATARLDEIERRMAGTEWGKEEANPLEFYTYAQLVRAYQRSVRSIMINIDEKARYRTASEKDVRKALKQLNSHIQGFIPRLEPLQKLAEDRQDEDLYLEWREAWKSSQQALQGSQYGLGAPEEKKDPGGRKPEQREGSLRLASD